MTISELSMAFLGVWETRRGRLDYALTTTLWHCIGSGNSPSASDAQADGGNVSARRNACGVFSRSQGEGDTCAHQASDFELRYIPSMKRGGKPYIGDENSRI